MATLRDYASGALDEEPAELLSSHLEVCLSCQQKLDTLPHRPDTILQSLRRSIDDWSADDRRQLANLIDQVTEDQPERESDICNYEEFVATLKRSRLLEDEEVDAFLASATGRDVPALARQLVSQKKLTSFQAATIMNGGWRLVFGKYVIEQSLGRGGMGRVFRARHRKMGRTVCLKILNRKGRKSPELVERFERETIYAGALHHPNIVVAHDAGIKNGIPYIVMELINGQNLAKHVAGQGTVEPVLAAQLILQCTAALDYAHGRGIIHRDIKPHNIMLTESSGSGSASGSSVGSGSSGSLSEDSSGDSGAPLVKILDMGLARFDSPSGQDLDVTAFASMTHSGALMGTVDYMAPEQAINSRKADNRSDIYGLGCTLFFLLAGRPPYQGETPMEKVIAHREDEIPDLVEWEDVPAELNAIFKKSVAKRPDDRYQSMAEMGEDIERWLGGVRPLAMGDHRVSDQDVERIRDVGGPSDDRKTVVPRQRQRRHFRTAILVSLVTALLLCLAFVIWGTRASRGSRSRLPERERAKPGIPLKPPTRHNR